LFKLKLFRQSRIARSTPSTVPVTIANADVQNVDFLAFRHATDGRVSGTVLCDPEYLSSLTVW